MNTRIITITPDDAEEQINAGWAIHNHGFECGQRYERLKYLKVLEDILNEQKFAIGKKMCKKVLIKFMNKTKE